MMDIMTAFFDGVEAFYNAIFVVLPDALRAIAFSLLLLTIGKCISKQHGLKFLIARLLLFIFYIFWGLYKFQILNLMSLPGQIFTLIGLILMGFALIITYWVREFSFFGYRIINYYSVWIFFFIALVFLEILDYRPGAIGFSIFYCALSFILLKLAKQSLKNL